MPALMTCYATAASIYTVVMKMDRKVMIVMLLSKATSQLCVWEGNLSQTFMYLVKVNGFWKINKININTFLFKICSSRVMAQLFHQKSKNTYGSIVF